MNAPRVISHYYRLHNCLIPCVFHLDDVTVTLYYTVKENANMEIGDTVKFLDALYSDENGQGISCRNKRGQGCNRIHL